MEPGYSIRSKPEYQGLAWHERAQAHVVISRGSAATAVLQLFQQKGPSQPVTVLHVHEASGNEACAMLAKAVGDSLVLYASTDALLADFSRMLEEMRMGTQFYLAGSESFMWAVAKVASQHGVHEDDILKQQVATLARPVYCVHCKATTPDVTTNIATCSQCGRKLFVRDHFSRRLGAYMGLVVDAEDPGVIPLIEEVYP